MSNIDISKIIVTNPIHVLSPAREGVVIKRPLSPTVPENQKQLIDKYDIHAGNSDTCFSDDILLNPPDKKELVSRLCEVMVRFDTDPKKYLKDDFYMLISLIRDAMMLLIDDTKAIKLESVLNQLKRLVPHYDVVARKSWSNEFVDNKYRPIELIDNKYSIDDIRCLDEFNSTVLNIFGESISSGNDAISTLEINTYGYLKFTIYARIDNGNSPGQNLSFSLELMDIDPRTNQITGSEIEIRGNEEFNDVIIDGIGYKKIIFNFKEKVLKPINIVFKRLNSSTARAKILIPKIQLAPDVIEIEDINDIFDK